MSRPPARPPLLALLLLALPAGAAAQGSPEWPLVPGRMGFNALPVLANVDPVIPWRGELELGAAAQLSGLRGDDAAATPYFRLTLPFREVAALEIDGTALEVFRTSSATQARLDARARSGVVGGDLRFGGRFLLLDEGRAPALGVRFVVKSTTGKALDSRRFTNAPGYEIDFLAGKEVGAVGAARLRALARVGLLVWQFGPARQDDALAYGATLRATGRGGASLALEWRGYAGWRFDDRPSLVGLTAAAPVRGLALSGSVSRGMSSEATPLELRLGVTTSFDVPGMARSRRADRAGAPRPPPAPAGAGPPATAERPREGGDAGDAGQDPSHSSGMTTSTGAPGAGAGWIDVTVPIHDGMVHWPGDPDVRVTRTSALERGDDATVSALALGAHTGTHVDAPAHFLAGGAGVDALDPAALIGAARVVSLSAASAIGREELLALDPAPGERLLLRTRNSERCWRDDRFVADFVHLSLDAARLLAERRVRAVGIDYLSVGGGGEEGRDVHRVLLGAGVCVLEGLDLRAVAPGPCELLCLPLRIRGGDGAPARALVRPLGG